MKRFTHALFGMGISLFVMSRFGEFDQLMIAYSLVFSIFPDLDLSMKHRSALHNVFSALAITSIAAYLSNPLIFSWGLTTMPWIPFFFSSAIAYLSHIFLDLLTKSGVALFWPISEKMFRLTSIRYDNQAANFFFSLTGALLILFALV